jgi:hypothetical protein
MCIDWNNFLFSKKAKALTQAQGLAEQLFQRRISLFG